MNTALTILTHVQETGLLSECRKEVQTELSTLILHLQCEMARKTQIDVYLALLTNGDIETWARMMAEANADFEAHGNQRTAYLHERTLMKESWAKYIAQI